MIFSFKLDLETVATAGRDGGVVAIGYILDGKMHEAQSIKDNEFYIKITAESAGERILFVYYKSGIGIPNHSEC